MSRAYIWLDQRPEAQDQGQARTVPHHGLGGANSEVDSKDHPTSKPTRLFSLPMEMHTKPRDLCYEPFAGSGSQLIAAEMWAGAVTRSKSSRGFAT
jgi:DNA modification methylase